MQNSTTFIAGMVIGFTQGWQQALLMVGTLPLIAGAGGWMAKNLAEFSKMGERAYRSAGGVAEQAISGIRTVASLCGERREKERYSANLRTALDNGLKKARANGLGFGMVMSSFFGTYGLGLWCRAALALSFIIYIYVFYARESMSPSIPRLRAGVDFARIRSWIARGG